MPNCKSCYTPITWTISPAGKLLPLDSRPYVILLRDQLVAAPAPATTRYRIDQIGDELHAVKDPEGTYVSHWVTCPTREQHREAHR